MAGHKIKEIRLRNGDTLKKLAQKINYDYSNLSKIERGIYTPSLALLKNIADVYGIDITYFMEVKDEYIGVEQQYVHNLDINLEQISEKYNLLLDGQKITQEEMEFMVDIMRKLRSTIKNQE